LTVLIFKVLQFAIKIEARQRHSQYTWSRGAIFCRYEKKEKRYRLKKLQYIAIKKISVSIGSYLNPIDVY